MPTKYPTLCRLPLMAAAATLGGWLMSLAGAPLAWLVGAMLTTAALTLAGFATAVPKALYRAGQIVVAVAAGLSVGADVAARIAPHLPVILAGALVSVALARMLSPALVRWGGMDPSTAHFAMIPAGITEMAELAGRHDADTGAVATFHTLRVMLVVALLPLAVLLALGPAGPVPAGAAGALDARLGLALGVGLAAALAAWRLGMPAAFFVGPLLAVSLLSGAGLVEAAAPAPLLAVAQVVLGLALGARFRRETVARMPRMVAVGLPILVLHGLLMAALALAAAKITGFDPLLLVLGLANGGAAEMVLTAKAFAADAALVAAYQIARGLTGNLLAGPIHRHTVRPRKP